MYHLCRSLICSFHCQKSMGIWFCRFYICSSKTVEAPAWKGLLTHFVSLLGSWKLAVYYHFSTQQDTSSLFLPPRASLFLLWSPETQPLPGFPLRNPAAFHIISRLEPLAFLGAWMLAASQNRLFGSPGSVRALSGSSLQPKAGPAPPPPRRLPRAARGPAGTGARQMQTGGREARRGGAIANPKGNHGARSECLGLLC